MGAEQRALIVGAGVAGVSAALWLRELGVAFDWVERGAEVGGVLHTVHNPITQQIGGEWADGAALSAALKAQLDRWALAPRSGVAVLKLEVARGEPSVTVELQEASGERTRQRWGAALLATGTARRRLGLEGEEAHRGRGVLCSGIAGQERLRGRRVVIVGGGDAALENVVILSKVAAHVTLVHWSDRLRARPEFIDKARAAPNVTLRLWSAVVGIEARPGAEFLTAVQLQGPGDVAERLEADALLVRIGVSGEAPPILLDGAPLGRDGAGYLAADPSGRTAHPRLFAAGDCACPQFRAVPVAAGQGAVAAQELARLLGCYGR